ncbi:MAG: hypothetical protein R3E96_12295 [Planctomycetota bacterium]
MYLRPTWTAALAGDWPFADAHDEALAALVAPLRPKDLAPMRLRPAVAKAVLLSPGVSPERRRAALDGLRGPGDRIPGDAWFAALQRADQEPTDRAEV